MLKNTNKQSGVHTMRPSQAASNGFTILELMIASTVFAVILLVITVGVISFTNAYYKGITASQTQSVARSIGLQLTQALQFSQNVTPVGTNTSGNVTYHYFCVDTAEYIYAIGTEVIDNSPNTSADQGYHGLIYDSTCASGVPAWPSTPSLSPSQRELLGQHMRLAADIYPMAVGSKLYTVRIKVIYGDDSTLYPLVNSSSPQSVWPGEQCAGSTGEQFCAVSDLATTIGQRLQ